MKFEDFMYWLPIFLFIVGCNIWFIIIKAYKVIILEIVAASLLLFMYFWSKYWLNRKFEKHKNQEESYY